MRRLFFSLIILFVIGNLSNLYAYDFSQGKLAEDQNSHEVLIRTAYNFGVLAKLENWVTDYGLNRFVPIIPEVGVNIQLYEHWYLSLTFDYARIWGKEKIVPVGRHVNIYAPTFGVKYISDIDDPNSDYFLDRSRWWIGLDLGCYITQLGLSAYTGLPDGWSSTNYDFGFNFSVGFDYFFHKIFGAGLQAKIHYVNLSSVQTSVPEIGDLPGDDYLLIQFGPHLVMRF